MLWGYLTTLGAVRGQGGRCRGQRLSIDRLDHIVILKACGAGCTAQVSDSNADNVLISVLPPARAALVGCTALIPNVAVHKRICEREVGR